MYLKQIANRPRGGALETHCRVDYIILLSSPAIQATEIELNYLRARYRNRAKHSLGSVGDLSF